MPDPFRGQPNGGPLRGPTPRVPPRPRPPQPPPGGTAGVSQQTSAAQLGTVLFAPGFGRRPSRPSRPRRSAPKRGGKSRRLYGTRKKRASSKRFVKGSAAAKRFMAKLRRMQKRKR